MSEAQSGAVDRRLAAFPDFAALYPVRIQRAAQWTWRDEGWSTSL